MTCIALAFNEKMVCIIKVLENIEWKVRWVLFLF